LPYQEALTVVATSKPGQVEAVENLLGTIKDHVDTWDIIPLQVHDPLFR
jgi:hypothetical protein